MVATQPDYTSVAWLRLRPVFTLVASLPPHRAQGAPAALVRAFAVP